MRLFSLCLIAASLASPVAADITYLESDFGVSFEGCDYEKLINLRNGYVWECSAYKYAYHYGVMTVLEVDGLMRLCIGDLEDAIKEFPDGDCFRGTLYQR